MEIEKVYMARQPRFVLPGQPQHVIQRGNNRQAIFCSPNDYEYYLEKLLMAAKEYECHIHSYVLMTNHVHLLLTPLFENSISKVMQVVGRYYVQYFNYHYHRTGTLWEGRYKASLIDTEHYLFRCMRYIELNPVRARMVIHPSEYHWSSYRHNALGELNNLITPHGEYERLGLTREDKFKCYQELFALDLEQVVIDEIRENTNKCWVLGNKEFKSIIEQKLNRKSAPSERGGDHKSLKYQERRINRV